MLLKILRDIARPQWFEIVMLLKRSMGLSVAELAKELGMSYMGVKQHCMELEKRGYVDTWRRPKEIGRPEKAYRLTEKAIALFPEAGSDLTLEILAAISETYGVNAAEKLLFNYFQKLGKVYEAKLGEHETVKERMQAFVKIRNREGRLSRIEGEDGPMLRLVEHHDPFYAIAVQFSSVHRMEEKMMERVFERSVSREEEQASGLTKITFQIG